MRIYTFFLFFFSLSFSYAQEIIVLDGESREPIFNVAIYNKDRSRSTLTDFDGIADLSIFSSEERLIFRHVSHLRVSTTKQRILNNEGLVLLEPNENQLEEIVLSASGFKQIKRNIPQKILSLSQQDIIFSSPQTSADLLKSSGQVYVQKSQLGGGSPMIRGFATNRLLINVDGVRMNTAIFRGGNVQNIISIDPLAVTETEVVLGPGSVIYGSDAIGGVLNFYTLSPEFSSEGSIFSGNIYSRYATANQEKTGHIDAAIGTEKWAFLSSISYSDFDDLRMGSHGPTEYLRQEYVIQRDAQDVVVPNENPLVQVPTGYDQVSLLEKLRYRPNEIWEFRLGLIYSVTSNYPRYDRLYRKKDGEFRAAEWYYGPQRWLQTNFQINKKGEGSLYDQAKFTAAYQLFEESRNDRAFEEEIFFETDEHIDAYSTNLDFEKDFGENKFFYGMEYIFNEVNSEGTETNILTGNTTAGASRYPDGSQWQSLASYSSFQWEINPELVMQMGARYNYIFLDATFDDVVYDFPFSDANIKTGALTGSAGLSWVQSEFMAWRLNFSTAFRAPNIDDVGKIFDSAPGMVVVPNPDLKPEYAYNSELGVEFNFEEVFILNLTGYYTYLDNALVRRNFRLDGQTLIDYQGEPSRVQAIQNAARAFVYGFEVGAEVNFSEHLNLNSRLSLTEGKEEQDDGTEAALRHAAPFFGSAHLVWDKNKLKLDLFAEYNDEIPYAELAPSESDKPYLYAIDANGNPYSPEWYTLNFATQYQLLENWLLTASLENITDQRYRTYSSGISAAGRNLILAARYSF